MASSPAREIDLLGRFDVRFEGRSIALSTKKAKALLAYLAARAGHPQPREKVQALLWSESGKSQAQASLRQTLFVLKQALPTDARPRAPRHGARRGGRRGPPAR